MTIDERMVPRFRQTADGPLRSKYTNLNDLCSHLSPAILVSLWTDAQIIKS
jgi:hypothetical protein